VDTLSIISEDEFVNYDKVLLDSIRTSIKELKAKKIVLEYELTEKEESVKNLNDINARYRGECDESYGQWMMARQENLDYISSDITASHDFGEVELLAEYPDTTVEKREILWKRLKHFRTIYFKLLQYIELREEEIKQLEKEEMECIEESNQLHKALHLEIEQLRARRVEMEKRIHINAALALEKRKENEVKRKEVQLLSDKVAKVEANTHREVIKLAKKLFK